MISTTDELQQLIKEFLNEVSQFFDATDMHGFDAGLINQNNGKYYRMILKETDEEELEKKSVELRHGE